MQDVHVSRFIYANTLLLCYRGWSQAEEYQVASCASLQSDAVSSSHMQHAAGYTSGEVASSRFRPQISTWVIPSQMESYHVCTYSRQVARSCFDIRLDIGANRNVAYSEVSSTAVNFNLRGCLDKVYTNELYT